MKDGNRKDKVSVSWFRRFMGLKDNDTRKDPTADWLVFPPKSPWTPTSAIQNPLPQPPSSRREEERGDKDP